MLTEVVQSMLKVSHFADMPCRLQHMMSCVCEDKFLHPENVVCILYVAMHICLYTAAIRGESQNKYKQTQTCCWTTQLLACGASIILATAVSV